MYLQNTLFIPDFESFELQMLDETFEQRLLPRKMYP